VRTDHHFSMDASLIQPLRDRRSHTRFAIEPHQGVLDLLLPDSAEVVHCQVVNLSHTGMCFRCPHGLRHDESFGFRFLVRQLDADPFLVHARIRWTTIDGAAGVLTGAEFQDSAKGWLRSGLDE
jgi:hypothetical protein